ncbi:MAG: aminoglycoside phosphotransferase family protein, partial [Pyrinomonadaceae bacterium]|nr:aminoglycoside phosphotransferase family protein [Phycisphaerales bacterium]
MASDSDTSDVGGAALSDQAATAAHRTSATHAGSTDSHAGSNHSSTTGTNNTGPDALARSPHQHVLPPVANPNGHTDYSSLATALQPALISACDGDLSNIEWFRSTWQSGGAATARAKFALTNGRVADVIVKLPVGPAEYRWTTRMEGLDAPDGAHCELEHGCTPRVFAAGTQLGGSDIAWLVVEKLPGHPLSHDFNGRAARDLLAAAVEWYDRAAKLRPILPADHPPRKDWAGKLARAREALDDALIADVDRWIDVVEQTQRSLPRLLEIWHSRPFNTWCHGDLHPGNVMRRGADEGSPTPGGCVLIDLALVHAGHWVEDVVYLERLFWARPDLLEGVDPVTTVSAELRKRSMQGSEDHALLANVRRVLMGASAPAFLAKEGNPRYLHAALETV